MHLQSKLSVQNRPESASEDNKMILPCLRCSRPKHTKASTFVGNRRPLSRVARRVGLHLQAWPAAPASVPLDAVDVQTSQKNRDKNRRSTNNHKRLRGVLKCSSTCISVLSKHNRPKRRQRQNSTSSTGTRHVPVRCSRQALGKAAETA